MRGTPNILTLFAHATQAIHQRRKRRQRSGFVQQLIQPLVITHRRKIELRADRLFLAAHLAGRMGFEFQDGAVKFV